LLRAIFIIVLVCPLNTLPQTNVDSSETLSRLKLSVGYFGGKYSEVGENRPFFNLNFRATQLLKYENPIQFSFAFEAGVNLVSSLFPLYAKTGPELEIIKNFILAGNVGCMGILIYPVPFYGVNGFYLIQLSKNFNLEIEGGFHSSFWIVTEPTYYISFGISFE